MADGDSDCDVLDGHPTMPSNRLSLRLGQLPHAVLAELAARLCSESPALQATANECIAAHNPLEHEMVERVLLSPDLVPQILGPLATGDGAAAAVCSQWLVGWKATNEPRRRLKQVAFNFPEELCNAEMQITSTPDGRLVVGTCSTAGVLYILDRSMRVLQRVPGHWDGGIAANDDSLFACLLDDAAVCRYPHDGAAATEYRLDGYTFWAPALAPGGLLFCVMSDQTDDYFSRTEIIALDAQTLQLRHRFGLGLLNDAHQLAVVVDELYVCDTGNHRLQVFSLTGEHLRSVTGEWRSPSHLCFEKDRLYLIEDGWPPHEDPTTWHMGEPGSWGGLAQPRRILVLSLQGDILQVITPPGEPTAVFDTLGQPICCFDRKLLASYYTTRGTGTGRSESGNRMLALQGL